MGIDLDASYARCREIHRHHGRTYFLATRLLPAWKRRHVHALYGFTRYTDEIVDRPGATDRAGTLRVWTDRFRTALDGGPADHPVLPAVRHTIAAFGLDHADFEAFLRSMAMDLTVTGYDTYADLLGYMDGSAAAIGTMMLPILGADDPAAAREPARQLGLAFQMTNFVRDVAEDLDRDRIYLPRADLDRFGVDGDDLRAAASARHAPAPVRALVRFEVDRARAHYAAAAAGIPMLAGSSQGCIRAAYHLYGGILDEIAAAGYDPFVRRATVPKARRLRVAVRSLRTAPGTPISASL